MKQTSLKQKIYRVAYAVIGFALLIGVTLGITQTMIMSYTRASDAASQGLRFINRTEMNYAHYLGSIRGYMMSPEKKEYKERFKKFNSEARADFTKAQKESNNPEILRLGKSISEIDISMDPIEQKLTLLLDSGEVKTAEKLFYAEHLPKSEQLMQQLDEARKFFANDRDAAMSNRENATMINDLLMAIILLISTTAIAVYSFRIAKSTSAELERIAVELADAAGSVRSVSSGVSSASHSLSEATTQQAAAIEETVSSMEEMSSMLAQTSQNTQATLLISEEAQHEGKRGKAVIARMLTAMDEIHESNERLESIVKMIDQIQSKTKVINDIVFETRLLSFNASIEAARAGAHGKGFAVVAEEVGKLAAMSGKAAEEIRTLLESSTAEVSSVVRGTQERVGAGRVVSQDCQAVFEVMSSSLEKIGDSVRMITAATKEQEQGVKQTNQAMGEMDQVTQKNSASAEALSSQSSHLSQGAGALMGSVNHLRSFIFGSEVPVTEAAEPNFEAALPMESKVEFKSTKPLRIVAKEPAKPADLDRSDSRWKIS